MNDSIEITKEKFIRLLAKYSIIIIILELLTRFAMVHILRFYQNTFLVESSIDYREIENITNVVRASIVMIMNAAIGIILLSDLDRKRILTWLLFGLTLLNPWMSIIFLLIWKTTEIKNYA